MQPRGKRAFRSVSAIRPPPRPWGSQQGNRRVPSAFGRALLGRLREEYRISGFSFAAGASIAAAVAVAVSTVLAPPPSLEPVLAPQVQAALERATSKQDNPVTGMGLLQTYWSNNGTWCRQYDITSGGHKTSALACRQEGQWRLVMQLPPAPAGATAPAASARAALDQFVQSHMKQPALDTEQAHKAARIRVGRIRRGAEISQRRQRPADASRPISVSTVPCGRPVRTWSVPAFSLADIQWER